MIGKGKNFWTSNEMKSYANKDANSFKSRSQSSIDFGNVTREVSPTKPGDDLVVQVQARLLSKLIYLLISMYVLDWFIQYKVQ